MTYMNDVNGRRLETLNVLARPDGDARYATRKLAAPLAAGNAAAGTLPAAVAGRTFREYPTSDKHSAIVLPFASQSAPSILALNFLDMRGWPGALDKAYCIYSTDHGTDPATTDCYLVTLADPYGTNRVDRGKILAADRSSPEASFVWLDWDLVVALGAGVSVASSKIAKTAHGLRNGKKLVVSAISGVTGLIDGGAYFVVSRTTDYFQLAATAGGSPLNITGTGTATISYIGAVCMLTSINTGVTWVDEAQATESVVRYRSPTGAGSWTLVAVSHPRDIPDFVVHQCAARRDGVRAA